MTFPTFTEAFLAFFGAAAGFYAGQSFIYTASYWGNRALTRLIHGKRDSMMEQLTRALDNADRPQTATGHGHYN